MLTVLTMQHNGGIFSPSVKNLREGNINIISLKNKNSLKKIKTMDFEKALIAPCAMDICGEYAKEYVCDNFRLVFLLPRVLAAATKLPLDELFVCAPPPHASKIIGACSSCAKLFSVVCEETDDFEALEKLYFSKGIVLRRVSAGASRVGKRAAAIKETGRCPAGMTCIDINKLGKIKLYGGELGKLAELCMEQTVETYLFGDVPLPEQGKISLNYGDGIFYLDRSEIL